MRSDAVRHASSVSLRGKGNRMDQKGTVFCAGGACSAGLGGALSQAFSEGRISADGNPEAEVVFPDGGRAVVVYEHAGKDAPEKNRGFVCTGYMNGRETGCLWTGSCGFSDTGAAAALVFLMSGQDAQQ